MVRTLTTHSPLSNAEQVEAWRAAMLGDSAARDRLVMSVWPLVQRIARNAIKKSDALRERWHVESCDVADEIVCELLRRLSTFDPTRGRFVPWVGQLGIDAIAKRFIRVALGSVETVSIDGTEEFAAAGMMRDDGQRDPAEVAEAREAWAILSATPTLGARTVERALASGMHYSEIATTDCVSASAIKQRVRNAIHSLQTRLGICQAAS